MQIGDRVRTLVSFYDDIAQWLEHPPGQLGTISGNDNLYDFVVSLDGKGDICFDEYELELVNDENTSYL